MNQITLIRLARQAAGSTIFGAAESKQALFQLEQAVARMDDHAHRPLQWAIELGSRKESAHRAWLVVSDRISALKDDFEALKLRRPSLDSSKLKKMRDISHTEGRLRLLDIELNTKTVLKDFFGTLEDLVMKEEA